MTLSIHTFQCEDPHTSRPELCPILCLDELHKMSPNAEELADEQNLSKQRGTTFDCAGVMTQAHTFDDRLHVTFMYNVPAVGQQRGRMLAQVQIAVLEVSTFLLFFLGAVACTCRS